MTLIDILTQYSIEFLTGITALILLVYTKETYLLRKESQKQTYHSFVPYLVIQNVKDEGLYMVNLGKGIAKDVIFEKQASIDKEQPLVNIGAIGAGEKKKMYKHSKDREGFWGINYGGYKELPEQFSISYEDLQKNKYEATFKNQTEFGSYIVLKQGRIP